MRRLLTVLSLALAAGVIPPAASGAVAVSAETDRHRPGVGIRLVDVPVATADDPRTRVYITDHVAPGTVIGRRVEVTNGTDSTQEVSVYPAAAQIRDGAFTGAEDRTQNELSGWISVTPRAPELEPGGRILVDVTITVPSNASKGERYGVVWAQITDSPEGEGVTQINRVGIRIYLSIGPGGAPPSDFAITSLTAARNPDGAPTVQANIHNTDRRALDLGARLELSDGPGGLAAGPFTTDLGTTLWIGKSAPVTLILDPQLPIGPWQARITVTSGLESRTAEAGLTFPHLPGPGEAVPIETNSGQGGGIPWWVFALALSLTLLLLVALIRRRRARPNGSDGRQDPNGPQPARVTSRTRTLLASVWRTTTPDLPRTR